MEIKEHPFFEEYEWDDVYDKYLLKQETEPTYPLYQKQSDEAVLEPH